MHKLHQTETIVFKDSDLQDRSQIILDLLPLALEHAKKVLVLSHCADLLYANLFGEDLRWLDVIRDAKDETLPALSVLVYEQDYRRAVTDSEYATETRDEDISKASDCSSRYPELEKKSINFVWQEMTERVY